MRRAGSTLAWFGLLFLLAYQARSVLPPEYEANRRREREARMRESRDKAGTVLTGEVVATNDRKQPTQEELRAGYTDTVILTVMVKSVTRAEHALKPGDTITVRYEVRFDLRPGPTAYEPPALQKGDVRIMWLTGGGRKSYSLAAGDMSFETPPAASTHDHRAASETVLD